MPPAAFVALKRASKGLLYPSETDAPFEVFTWKNPRGALTHEKLLGLAGLDRNCPIAVTSLDDFFAELTLDQEEYGSEEKAVIQKYRALRHTCEKYLTDAKVYRVGEVEVAVYLVGKTLEGDLVGLKTLSVET